VLTGSARAAPLNQLTSTHMNIDYSIEGLDYLIPKSYISDHPCHTPDVGI